jgi:hypothetical protein
MADKTTAANLAHDLIIQGYRAVALSDDGVLWKVHASTLDGSPVPGASIAAFAAAHGVTWETSQAVFG